MEKLKWGIGPVDVLERFLHYVLSEDSIVGPRGNGFSPGKDGEAGDIGFIVDAAGCGQVENEPLEAKSSLQTEPVDRCVVGQGFGNAAVRQGCK